MWFSGCLTWDTRHLENAVRDTVSLRNEAGKEKREGVSLPAMWFTNHCHLYLCHMPPETAGKLVKGDLWKRVQYYTSQWGVYVKLTSFWRWTLWAVPLSLRTMLRSVNWLRKKCKGVESEDSIPCLILVQLRLHLFVWDNIYPFPRNLEPSTDYNIEFKREKIIKICIIQTTYNFKN